MHMRKPSNGTAIGGKAAFVFTIDICHSFCHACESNVSEVPQNIRQIPTERQCCSGKYVTWLPLTYTLFNSSVLELTAIDGPYERIYVVKSSGLI